MSPFKALYGRDPPMMMRYIPSGREQPDLQQQLLERDQLLQQLKHNLLRSQQKMKSNADKKRIDVTMEVGQQVLVKLQPYRQGSVALRKNQKLGMRYFGPFPIIAKVGKVAFKLQLPDSARIHPVFHISQLKIFKGNSAEPYLPLPLTTAEQGPVLQPECILQRRVVLQGDQEVKQVLVKWQSVDAAEATWETEQDITESFPELNLEDKITFEGEGNVMNKGVTNTVNQARVEQGTRASNRLRRPHPMWGQFVAK